MKEGRGGLAVGRLTASEPLVAAAAAAPHRLCVGSGRRHLLRWTLTVLWPWGEEAGSGWANVAWAQAAPPAVLTLASTTSTAQSGLFDHLWPLFRRDSAVAVRVVAVGTGQALDIARRGDADAVLVHDVQAEARFLAEGYGIDRREIMRNDFVLIGPRTDPAGAAGNDIVRAMRRLANSRAAVVSRGDRSGTHEAELRLWAEAGASPARGTVRECGCGMGAALNMAAALGAYVLSDRATWLAFRNRADLAVLVEGDARLANPYSLIRVNPARHPHVQAQAALRLADWLSGPLGQAAIAAFTIDGQRPFVPTAAARR
ncbi:substrate-binding domain-containing protein [Tepidimonas sp.]|uniref:substrate-binding domain-containing protein n=1 Tax=Tepidimonas sp. TaxID=2002775 RepID=UPI002FE23348